MDQYCQITITATDMGLKELLIAQLAEMGYDGFEETDAALNAFVLEDKFSEQRLNFLLDKYSLSHSKSIIKKQNWNELWESNFEPVRIADFVGIRAAFHPPFTGVQHEIVITPKMSFGTGHHATTNLVMQLMEGIDFAGKRVYDFGTGTGILAILAEKLGATGVVAVDNDDWCIENATENILVNKCKTIDIQKVNIVETNVIFDIVIANINKNIILDNLSYLVQSLKQGGEVLLSGLLVEDESDILAACKVNGWEHIRTIEKSGWIACQFHG